MNRLKLVIAMLCMAMALCSCSFESTPNKTDSAEKTKTHSTTKKDTTEKEAESDFTTLPNTIDTYAKNYTEVGEVLPSKSIMSGNQTQTEVKAEESKKEGMAVYNSELGYSLEYPEIYAPKRNFDGKEFIIIDEKSGSNMNVILTYPNILYESEETYSKALEGNQDMRLKSFEVKEINGINAVEIELAIVGGYVYQTVYRTGEYYYVLSYVQGRGVTRTFDSDMRAILNSLKLK